MEHQANWEQEAGDASTHLQCGQLQGGSAEDGGKVWELHLHHQRRTGQTTEVTTAWVQGLSTGELQH